MVGTVVALVAGAALLWWAFGSLADGLGAVFDLFRGGEESPGAIGAVSVSGDRAHPLPSANVSTIRFLGGTDTVTGSKFLVEGGRGPVLVDCGMFQGPRQVKDLNWEDPFFSQAPLPDEVLITHAHIDHTGWLPRLVGTHGFAGPIHCTPATADLLAIMLPDSARLQKENADYANKKGYSRHRPGPASVHRGGRPAHPDPAAADRLPRVGRDGRRPGPVLVCRPHPRLGPHRPRHEAPAGSCSPATSAAGTSRC